MTFATEVDVTVVVRVTVVTSNPEDAEAAAEREVFAALARGEDTSLTVNVVGSLAVKTEAIEVQP